MFNCFDDDSNRNPIKVHNVIDLQLRFRSVKSYVCLVPLSKYLVGTDRRNICIDVCQQEVFRMNDEKMMMMR